MRKIIGLTGKAGVGKDTFAKMLQEFDTYGTVSFASPLKEMLATIGFPEPSDRKDKESQIEGFNFTWREAAQKLGTEWARGLDEDIWVKIAKRKILANPKLNIIVTDVRFSNEAEMIQKLGGYVVEIVGRDTTTTGDSAKHASELGVSSSLIDITVNNNSTIDDLRDQAIIVNGIVNRIYD